jgi:hypothetical protein
MLSFPLVLVAVTLSAQTVPPHCLEYEPSVVHLTGQIQRHVFPGPPNYSSIKDGDERDVQWVLHLSSSVCVNGKRGDDLNNESEVNIREMQLVIMNDGDWKRYTSLIGKNVQLTGTLFHAYTGHHRTPVLLTVRLIEPQPGRSKM